MNETEATGKAPEQLASLHAIGSWGGTRIVTTNLWKCLRTSTAMLLALILFPNLSRAQTDNVLPKVLTLEDALNYALQHYPAVRASLEQVSAARAGVTLARTQYLPQLNGVYQVSRATQNQVNGIWLPTPITPSVEGPIGPASGQSFWNSQAAALFSWEPLDFGLRSAKVGQARSAEVKSQADLALTQLQVATAVGNCFLLAVANQQVVLAAHQGQKVQSSSQRDATTVGGRSTGVSAT
jgi:outer membrane protein TolC